MHHQFQNHCCQETSELLLDNNKAVRKKNTSDISVRIASYTCPTKCTSSLVTAEVITLVDASGS